MSCRSVSPMAACACPKTLTSLCCFWRRAVASRRCARCCWTRWNAAGAARLRLATGHRHGSPCALPSNSLCFAEQWQALQAQHDLLRVNTFLTRDPSAPAARINAESLAQLAPDLAERTVLACGPAGFVDLARTLSAGAAAFHAEGFTPPTSPASEHRTVRVELRRQGLRLDLPTDQPLLAALESAGQRPAHGCRQGMPTRHLQHLRMPSHQWSQSRSAARCVGVGTIDFHPPVRACRRRRSCSGPLNDLLAEKSCSQPRADGRLRA